MLKLKQLAELGGRNLNCDFTTFPGKVALKCRQSSVDSAGVYTYTEHSVIDNEEEAFDELIHRLAAFNTIFRNPKCDCP